MGLRLYHWPVAACLWVFVFTAGPSPRVYGSSSLPLARRRVSMGLRLYHWPVAACLWVFVFTAGPSPRVYGSSSLPLARRRVSMGLRLYRWPVAACLWVFVFTTFPSADRLAGVADTTSSLQLGRAEVLRGLRNFLNMDRPEYHSIDHLKERGVEKGSSRHSTLQGLERSEYYQANIRTVSRATLGRLLRDGTERVWAFPSATMPS